MTQRREFIGRLIVAGPTRTMTGGPGGYVVPGEAIREAVDEGLFEGLACFVDHARGGPSVRRLVGVWRDVVWQAASGPEAAIGSEAAGAAVGRLAAYETEATRPVLDLLEQWIDEVEGGPDVGVSIVFYPQMGDDGRTVRRIVMVESADLVMFPASAGSRIVRRVTSDERRSVRPRTPTSEEGEALGRMLQAAGGALQLAGNASLDAPNSSLVTRHSSLKNGVWATGGNGHGMGECEGRLARPGGGGEKPQISQIGERGNRGVGEQGSDVADGRGGRKVAIKPGGFHSHSQYTNRLFANPQYTDHSPATQPRERMSMNQLTEQESRYMTQETETMTTGARRVALVRGEGEKPQISQIEEGAQGRRGPDGSPGAGAQAEQVRRTSENASHLLEWVEALKTTAASAVIRASGLPAAVQERLGEGRYESADEVYAAVERARGELAALNEAGVVRLGGTPPREGGRLESGRLRLRDGLDEARDLVGFFFGAADSPTPPPNLRSFADLYVALTGDVHFRGVFDGGRVQFSGATTATLPNLAVDAMNRVIVQQFQALEHYRWYERVATAEPNDGSLQAMKWITLGGIGNLPAVSEGAAYTELSVADVKETAAFVKRGGYVGITREMIKNGNIMQLQAIPRALASAAVRTRSAAVSALFTSSSGVGPTLAQDSLALFHATHANLATTALGTDATAWRAARQECFQHAELGSAKPLGIFPRYLLVPAELYDTALSILGYGEGMPTTYSPEAQGRGFADPRPIPLVVPDWTDATDWAYIVDPAVFPVIQMSYSQSPGGRTHPIPELFAVVSETSGLMFSNDILPIKVRDEFAVGVNGPRGIGKRNVA